MELKFASSATRGLRSALPLFTVGLATLFFFARIDCNAASTDRPANLSLRAHRPPTLTERLQIELEMPMATLTPEVLDAIRSHHHVLVPGMMNELAHWFGLYYVEIQAILRSLDADFTYLPLPTHVPISKNAETLALRLKDLGAPQPLTQTQQALQIETPKPITLIGHSKGGAESFLSLLRHPELLLNGTVDQVVLEQAAIHGSALARPRPWSVLQLLAQFYFADGLFSLESENQTALLDEAFEQLNQHLMEWDPSLRGNPEGLADLRNQLSRKIHYVRTYQSPDALSLGTQIVLWACHNQLDPSGEANDGLLTLSDQKDDRMGEDLGVLQADHVDLSIHRLTQATPGFREAFARALLGQLYARSPESNGPSATFLMRRLGSD
jgi:hypothetical protein